MLVVGRYDFITFTPVNTIGDDIHALAGIIGEGNLTYICIEEACDAHTCVVTDSAYGFPCGRAYTAVSIFILQACLHGL